MMYNLFDTVELLRASDEVVELRAGAQGFVVEVIEPDGLFVEFLDEASPADTIAVLSLHTRDVRLVRTAEPRNLLQAQA